jgi:hypothetical protein
VEWGYQAAGSLKIRRGRESYYLLPRPRLNEGHFLPIFVALLVIALPLENRSLLDLPTVSIKIITNSDVVGRTNIYQTNFNKLYQAVPGVPNLDVGRIFDNGDIGDIFALIDRDGGHVLSSFDDSSIAVARILKASGAVMECGVWSSQSAMLRASFAPSRYPSVISSSTKAPANSVMAPGLY